MKTHILLLFCVVISLIMLYEAIAEKVPYKIIAASCGAIGFSTLLFFAFRKKAN